MSVRFARVAAALLASANASIAFAGYTFTTTRTLFMSGTSQLERVVLYARADAASGDLFAADLTVTTTIPNGLKFSVITDPDTGESAVSFLNATPEISTRTRASNLLFNTVAPGFPIPAARSQADVELYRAGLTRFQIAGFDGRTSDQVDVGLKADGSQNAGRGAALFSAVVPFYGWSGPPGTAPSPPPETVFFSGEVADEQGILSDIRVTYDPGPANLVVVLPPPQTVTFGTNVGSGAPFSVAVQATSSNASDVLSLVMSPLPAGVSGIMISPASSASPATFTVSGLLNYSTNWTTVTLPFVVAGLGGSSMPGAIVLNVVPEPAAMATCTAAIGLGHGRRRRCAATSA